VAGWGGTQLRTACPYRVMLQLLQFAETKLKRLRHGARHRRRHGVGPSKHYPPRHRMSFDERGFECVG